VVKLEMSGCELLTTGNENQEALCSGTRLARLAMAAGSSSLMSTALRKLLASLVLNCGGLP
jgi:hypothetical protein